MNDKSVYIFVSSERQERVLQHIVKTLGKHNGSITMLSVTVGFMIGTIVDMKQRLKALETRLDEVEKAE